MMSDTTLNHSVANKSSHWNTHNWIGTLFLMANTGTERHICGQVERPQSLQQCRNQI